MGVFYKIKVPFGEGTRNVRIPNLRSANGREYWARLKSAAIMFSGGKSEALENSFRLIDQKLALSLETYDHGDGMVLPAALEHAVAKIMCYVEDQIRELAQALRIDL